LPLLKFQPSYIVIFNFKNLYFYTL